MPKLFKRNETIAGILVYQLGAVCIMIFIFIK